METTAGVKPCGMRTGGLRLGLAVMAGNGRDNDGWENGDI